MKTSRKDQIKRAIMRKPKYGGPQGGRPSTGSRLGKAKATGNGINYLKGSPYEPPWVQQGRGGEGNIKPSLQGEIDAYKKRKKRQRNTVYENPESGMQQGPKKV